MQGAIAIDTETSIYNNGSAFDKRNNCVCYSWCNEAGSGAEQVSENSLKKLSGLIGGARIIVGANIKFDLHWFRRLGINLDNVQVWDVLLAEFILSHQKWKYPSLNESVAKYSLGSKIDLISEKYWKNGIQTEDIPWSELAEYASQDAVLTYSLYQKQVSVMTPSQRRLCRLMNMDLLILQEMEWNGLKFDEELANKRTGEIKEQVQEVEEKLLAIYPNVPISFNSGDDLSAFLYGGSITEVVKEHIGFFKSGQKVGEPRYRNVEVLHELPRLFTPLPRSELKKKGYYQTGADVLLKLRGNKTTRGILELIQRRTRLTTLLEKTYMGLTKVHREQNWEPGFLHGQYNQVTVSTGRLSSSKPNMQNLDGAAQDLFQSRYND